MILLFIEQVTRAYYSILPDLANYCSLITTPLVTFGKRNLPQRHPNCIIKKRLHQ